MWRYTPGIPAFRKLRQENRIFNATLDYMCAQAHRHENGHVQDTELLLPTFVPPSDHRCLGLYLTVPSTHNELVLNLVTLDSDASFAHVSSIRTDLGISMR